jgi:hypothetical protein
LLNTEIIFIFLIEGKDLVRIEDGPKRNKESGENGGDLNIPFNSAQQINPSKTDNVVE